MTLGLYLFVPYLIPLLNSQSISGKC